MCYFLYLASPLTLSEVRSMLPPGLTADLAFASDQQTLREIHPEARTVARILAGRCSCDLVRPRLAGTKEDERHLRERYRGLDTSRPQVIAALERHRQGRVNHPAPPDWPVDFSRFVVEHARNAGASLYYLHFSPVEASPSMKAGVQRVTSPMVAAEPRRWLQEGCPTVVTR